MAFGVFLHRSDSIYDDSPAEQYQFPRQYLSRVEPCVGQWIVYLEPTKVRDSRGYFAIAQVRQVIPDPKSPNMFLAVIEPGSYLEFVNPVPFRDGAAPVERGLLNPEGKLSGRAQSAVRPISPVDFNRILELGLEESAAIIPRQGEVILSSGFAEAQTTYMFEQPRERVQTLTSRLVRDRVFR